MDAAFRFPYFDYVALNWGCVGRGQERILDKRFH